MEALFEADPYEAIRWHVVSRKALFGAYLLFIKVIVCSQKTFFMENSVSIRKKNMVTTVPDYLLTFLSFLGHSFLTSLLF